MSIYLDNNSTTAVAPEVLEALLPWFRERPGNPSSLHRLGVASERAVRDARAEVARALACEPSEVVFTSGGTESNNLALRGAVAARRRRGDHIVTTTVEHPCVARTIDALEAEGLRVTRVPVDAEAGLDPRAVLAAVEPDTILISVMHVQNETGAVFPIERIARQAKQQNTKVLFHSDGVQALGKVAAPGPLVDLYAVSGHKLHGPKGVGALRIGRTVKIPPLLHGGGQERGLRSGTEPVPLLVGLGEACRLAHTKRIEFTANAAALRDLFLTRATALGAVLNSPVDGVPSTINLSFVGVAAEPLLHALEERGVYASTGSACASGKGKKSPVLRALGLSDARVDSALRFSLSRETTRAEIDQALNALDESLRALRAALPS